MRYRFGDYCLDADHFELKRGAASVPLEPKVFDVLAYLVRERERVVSKDELLGQLWPGEHVVDAVVVRCIYAARKALGQSDVYSAPIATVRARGYRFAAEVCADAPDQLQRDAEPFVGREPLVQRLSALLASARAGRGALVLLCGEAGIGKTRAAEALAANARRDGVEVLVGRCFEGDGVPSFWPFTEVVRACLRTLPAQSVAAALGQSAQRLSVLLPEVSSAPAPALALDGASASAEFLLFDAVGRLLRLAAEHTPRLLILEDLHWADLPSLKLLSFLARDLGERAMLVVGTLRDGDVDAGDARRPRLEQLGKLRPATRIDLAPLARSDVDAYVTQLFGRALPELARALYERSDGHPFFMVEALRPHVTAPPEALEAARIELPSAIRDIVRERLSRLPEATRALLSLAAVSGRAFDAALLSPAGGAAGVVNALEPALALGLLRPTGEGPGRFDFTHAFMREVVYAEASAQERLRLHARLAEHLERRSVPAYTEIAFHLLNALPLVDPARVVHYCALAGRTAAAQHAYHAAAAHYEHAIEALAAPQGDEPQQQRIALLLALGHACRKAGESKRAIRTFHQAADQARRQERPIELAQAILGLRDSQPLRATLATPVEDLLREALRGLPEGELVLRARVSSRLAAVGARTQRREMSARATELARGLQDAATRSDVLNARLAAAQDPNEVAERLAIADELEQLAREHAEPDWMWEARAARYDAYLRLGDRAAATRAFEACEALAEESRHAVMQLEVLRHRTQCALCEGRYAEAHAGMARASELRKDTPHGLAEVHTAVQTLWLMRDQGLLGRIGEEMAIFLARQRWSAELANAPVALAYAEKGNLVRARAGLDFYTRARFENVPYGKDYVATCAHLAVTASLLADLDACQHIYEMLAPYAWQHVVDRMLLYFGSASHFLGLLADALGRGEQAIGHFEQALQMNLRMQVLPAQVRTELALARALGRTRAGQVRAAELTARARTTASRIGMRGVTDLEA